ncbi:hypothetical protein AEQ67_18230 [Pseudomonas sp. RIT-PI-q]|uniref:hypothetical protein n=1 Tax=Pseudomonas sp. RIT-PI-q TaxID=1690247 RepID=UPI0006CDD401|nr:hypothetical protein [Pseudomonas sp. RIT-PI-q]KPG95894.1 hypothetical protein AEQ67_18230 [Pseudomonas sp. RIT-PI-q]
MNEQYMDVVDDANDQSEEDSMLPQDGFIGHRRQYLSVQMHCSYSGTEEWATYFSMGIATDAQKSPLVEEIREAGAPLNSKYFLNTENLELWINGQLAGLCRYRLSGHGDQDLTISDLDAPNKDEPYDLDLSLLAVFIRPQYHSKGLGYLLSVQLADLVASGVLSRIVSAPFVSPHISFTVTADFESSEGERFFEGLTEELEIKLNAVSTAVGTPIKISVDAGY